MRQHVAISLAVVLSSTTSAMSQPPTTPAAKISGDPTGTLGDKQHDICISDVRVYDTITVGNGRKQIKISFGSGVCDPAEPKITSVLVRRADDDMSADGLIAETCPALRSQVSKLKSAQIKTSPDYGEVRNVRAGPFVITGRDLFGMRDPRGQTAASRWIRETLSAARPCWNNFRQDQTRTVVESLYAALGLNP